MAVADVLLMEAKTGNTHVLRCWHMLGIPGWSELIDKKKFGRLKGAMKANYKCGSLKRRLFPNDNDTDFITNFKKIMQI